MAFTPQQQAVWDTVHRMNSLWTTERDCAGLAEYFHREMVAIVPLTRERLTGRAACLAGWESFVNIAQIHDWREIDPMVQLYADDTCAVVTYYYEMDVTMNGMRLSLAGRDMMTLVKEDGRWWLVADQFSANP